MEKVSLERPGFHRQPVFSIAHLFVVYRGCKFESKTHPKVQNCMRYQLFLIYSLKENMANVQTSNSYFCAKSRHFSQAEKITELNCIHAIYERNCSCFHLNKADDSFSLK